jgi:TPR repeat protein
MPLAAQLSLGALYAQGMGVEKDEAKAARLYAQAAEQSHADAQYLSLGQGVEKDEAKAARLCAQAAEQGRADAQYLLGNCFLGPGCRDGCGEGGAAVCAGGQAGPR